MLLQKLFASTKIDIYIFIPDGKLSQFVYIHSIPYITHTIPKILEPFISNGLVYLVEYYYF
jgi:hypothetical protein